MAVRRRDRLDVRAEPRRIVCDNRDDVVERAHKGRGNGRDRTTRNLIESSKGDLMRALAKKGLELDILRAR